MTGVGSWADSFNKARSLVGKMTLDEKISLTVGVRTDDGCSGNIPAIDRLDFPGLCLSDAGNGIRSTDFVSSWPSGIHVGASWNRDLAKERAVGMGSEFRKKGVNVLLGPVVGPAGRTIKSGRIWEGFSIDPYLSGALVYDTVIGVQDVGVITSTKHYIANEQETNRQPQNDVESVSSNIDDQTMHELYLWPFADAVRAGSANIMCSYNRINNSYGCANSYTLNGILKTELGFQGFVVSDWDAQHAGVATALAGLDMTMPTDRGVWGPNLSLAVTNGSVPESRVDDMAIRIIASWYQMGQDKGFPSPGIGMPGDLTKPHRIVDARNSTFKSTLLNGAIEGHVLVKNVDKALPLKTPKMLSIFGYSAKVTDQNDVGFGLAPWILGATSSNFSDLVAGFTNSAEENHIYSPIAYNGTLFSGGGSGATSQSLVSSPFEAITQQAYEDDTALFWDFRLSDPAVNPASDACLVFGNAYAAEGYDRPSIRDDFTDGLIKHVADRCNNTIVIFHNAGVRLVDGFIDHPNVTALIFAHLPGQDSGRALVSLLYGKSNPSGKLPYTVARNESDYGDVVDPDLPEGIFELFPQSNFTEGIYVDYRHFDVNNITPRYEFGFGLSYTTFNYSNITISKVDNATTAEYPTGAIREGGQVDLWDVLAKVTAEVKNTGDVDGAEVVQLYVGIPGNAPVRQLRGFDKPFINATKTATVSFELTRRDLSFWDTTAQKWKLQQGNYTVSVGSSSRDLPLVGKLEIS
ncbi:putative glycoside hydrolase family 3 protein [Phaeoacremonium minimum UCRPA7]|uniref:Beta-glucosidase cel3A n=1 Tax=Phaeoacremonium minimum (strain UCR-PA7) TaxID=1286976 RepID=R8B8I2_PHAM7|nr:putative glycoside hydrolase family 3 protein [Phaeoacremonium minimum UCRPA7]EON95603.1 putative glycoside hydrolase family 3 protein [Phaeoacremonium minimum UCRPA7]